MGIRGRARRQRGADFFVAANNGAKTFFTYWNNGAKTFLRYWKNGAKRFFRFLLRNLRISWISVKIYKLVILDPHIRLENLKMAWNQWYITKTEFFLLSKKSNYFFQNWSLSAKTGEIKNGPNFVRNNIKIFWNWPSLINVNLWENGMR